MDNRSQQLGRYAAPLVKRFVDKVSYRQNQAPQVPRPHRYIRERDFFDLAELAFDDHDVVNQYRLRQRNLNTGEHITERLLRSETDDDACDSRRRKNAGAELPHRIEKHQDGTSRDNHYGADD